MSDAGKESRVLILWEMAIQSIENESIVRNENFFLKT